MAEVTICDYSDYDYKSEFWTNQNRNYEHLLEISVVNRLLKKYAQRNRSILDAGCGFGRLFPSYQELFTEYHLVDYAKNLLDQAKETQKEIKNIHYYQQSLYELNINNYVDAIISIRTLHHLNDINELFKRFYQQLSENGVLIIDIPNHYHLKNKIRYPFRKRMNIIKISNSYYNYDPVFIIEKLKETGFNIIEKKQIGLFRIGFIKPLILGTGLPNISDPKTKDNNGVSEFSHI